MSSWHPPTFNVSQIHHSLASLFDGIRAEYDRQFQDHFDKMLADERAASDRLAERVSTLERELQQQQTTISSLSSEVESWRSAAILANCTIRDLQLKSHGVSNLQLKIGGLRTRLTRLETAMNTLSGTTGYTLEGDGGVGHEATLCEEDEDATEFGSEKNGDGVGTKALMEGDEARAARAGNVGVWVDGLRAGEGAAAAEIKVDNGSLGSLGTLVPPTPRQPSSRVPLGPVPAPRPLHSRKVLQVAQSPSPTRHIPAARLPPSAERNLPYYCYGRYGGHMHGVEEAAKKSPKTFQAAVDREARRIKKFVHLTESVKREGDKVTEVPSSSPLHKRSTN
ncbi:hypothetical protein HK101_010768 [Irineochytrium annulatum]|nr:hypothetical protein HK101_010768 [Irineochytrium annulatum]